MNCNEANALAIDEFLAARGVEPVKTRGHVKWYLSPIRVERTASFAVDTRINRWYDFGIGQGGDLVELGMRLSKCSVSEFLSELSRNNFKPIPQRPAPAPELIPEWKVDNIKPISHPALIAYLKLRSIPVKLANTYCSQVYYSNDKQNYFAIGFKNDSEGYEVRNSVFKGCIGKKDITTIHKDLSRVAVFEGFMDFLSAHQLVDRLSTGSVIILNSITQLPKAIDRIQSISPIDIDCYLDNDEAGRKCTEELLKKFPHAVDRAKLYHSCKDVNDFLISKQHLSLSIQ